jgi:NAD-dependent histone deacetylase SIR2
MAIQHLDLDTIVGSTSSVDFPKRRRLDELSASIVKAKRVVVVSGAGISCSSGIPVGLTSP